MLKECIEVFEHELKEKGEHLILDSYVPADGTYLIVDKLGNIKATVEIKKDKEKKLLGKGNPFFSDICFYDYQSSLVSMNKPVDGKKVIHSNNYLSFFVKKESILSKKLTEEIIDGYYDILKNPLEKKYKNSKEASKIYQLFQENEGKIDEESLEQKRQWIKEHIFLLDKIDMTKKEYLKIFFEEDKDIYIKEGKRYLLPNIYNSNNYNIEIENMVYGLPDNNLGMNAKKPFLSIKTRKIPTSFLLNGKDVLVQKQFFDYLMNFAAAGKYNLYIDTSNMEIKGYKNGEAPEELETGYYLRIKKGKNEAEIQMQDNISGYKQKLNKDFEFKSIVFTKYRNHPEYNDSYKSYYNLIELGGLINEVFFSKWLSGNYFTETKDMMISNDAIKTNIVLARDTIFDWIYKGIDNGIEWVLEKTSMNLIKESLLNGYKERAVWQLNLRISFKEYFMKEGEESMAEIVTSIRERVKEKVLSKTIVYLEKDEDYYYAVGQLVNFLLSLSKAKDKNQSLLNPFLNAKTDEMLKKRINQLYKKYNYAILTNSIRVNNLLTLVKGYVPAGKVNEDMIILGYASDNLIYLKEEK